MEYLQLTVYFLMLFITSYCIYIAYLKKGSIQKPSKGRKFLTVLFIGYICGLVALTIIPSERFSLNQSIELRNYLPVINTYKRYAMVTYFENHQGIKMFWQNFIGNILIFIPMGIFLLLLYKKNFFGAITIAFFASSFIELTQFIFSFFGYYRFIDIDDVLLNTFGAALGYFASSLFVKKFRYGRLLSLSVVRY